MIIVRLAGGLGNQMFQYSLGRTLSLKTGFPLYMDTGEFKANRKRTYSLRALSIKGNVAPFLLAGFPALRSKLGKCIVGLIYKDYPKLTLRREDSLQFNSSVLAINNPVYLTGYWQSPKYFQAYRSTLCEELVPKRLSSQAKQLQSLILSEADSVALHIRRGDYVSDPDAHAILGVLPMSYYECALQTIYGHIQNPRFFIFSDDHDWIRSNLSLDIEFTCIKTNTDYEDLFLMSQCKHCITANSTFSWWAAYLNNNENKLVVAPQRWFKDGSLCSKDLIPKSWTTV